MHLQAVTYLSWVVLQTYSLCILPRIYQKYQLKGQLQLAVSKFKRKKLPLS